MQSELGKSTRQAPSVQPLAGEGWAAEVREQLTRILTSSGFEASERSRRMLRHLVEEVLAGRGAQIKQYSIAVDVMDRGEDFDPRVDPVVRAEASKLRRALEHYYLTGGRDDPIRMVLPKGGYVIQFRRLEQVEDYSGRASAAKSVADGERHGARIAVLPLLCVEPSPDVDVLAAGLTHELITAMSRFEGLEVIAHHSVLGADGGQIDPDTLTQELDLDFLVSGTLRLAGSHLRLDVRMTDAANHTIAWSETYDREWSPEATFEIEEDICSAVSGRLAGRYGAIGRAVARSSARAEMKDNISYSAALTFHAYNVDPGYFDLARERLAAAVAHNPDNALTLSMLTEVETDALVMNLGASDYDLPRLLSMAKKAVQLDANSQQAQQTLGYVYFHCKDYGAATEALERCVAINPNAPYMVGFCGFLLALAGNWERGTELLEKSERLNPRHPGWFSLVPLVLAWREGDFISAGLEAEKFNTPALCWDPLLRAATQVRCGRRADAAVAIDELLKLDPNFAVNAADYIGGFVADPETADDILAALRETGLKPN